jgi:hypothetical protein
MRKTVYLSGIMLSLMIWAVVEGFGGPYGPGSTNVGAAIMYAFIFVAIIIVERSSNYSKYSIDVLIERKLNGWKHLAEFYDEKSSSKMDGLQTAHKTILPKLDPLLVEDVILNQQQNQEDVENDITTYDMTSDRRSPLDRIGPTGKEKRQSN